MNYYKEKRKYKIALEYANSLFDRNGNTREEAQSLVYELNNLVN